MTSDGVLRAVQHTAAALVELLAARAAAEPAIALGGALGPLRHGLRPALYAAHSHPLRRGGRLHIAGPALAGQRRWREPWQNLSRRFLQVKTILRREGHASYRS